MMTGDVVLLNDAAPVDAPTAASAASVPRKPPVKAPELRDFAKYGMLANGDELQYLVATDPSSLPRTLTATVGWAARYGWRLFVQLSDLGNEESQRDILRHCCSQYDKVESQLGTSVHTVLRNRHTTT